MNKKRERKRRTKKVILIVLACLLALILLAAVAAMILLNRMLGLINRVGPTEYTVSSSEAEVIIGSDPDLIPIDPTASDPYVHPSDITPPTGVLDTTLPTDPAPSGTEQSGTGPNATTPTTKPKPPAPPAPDIYGEHLVNILLVGQDRWEGQSRQRSDSMILVSINKSDNTITLTSFMRDMYVYIPGYKPNKLNAAYAFGGMSLLSKTLEVNFGVKVDGVVEVNLSGFSKLIDMLGGVEVTLTKSEAKYLNDLYYEAKILDSPVVVGKNRLDGDQALVYVRLREIDTDYQRARRQRTVIAALIEAYKNQPLDQMIGMMDDILPLITTNLTNTEILGYAVDLFPLLSTAKVQTLRIPVEGTFVGGLVVIRPGFYGWFQYNINFEANKEVLWELFRRKN